MAIEQAFEKLRARIKPAVLDPGSFANGQVMKAYLDAKGFDSANADDDALATALYEAVNATAEKLKWLVKPAKLAKFVENEKVRSDRTALADQAAFAEKSKVAEAAKEKRKAQEAAFKRIDSLIASFQLTDGTRIMHGRTGLAQDKARKFVQKQIEAKADLEATERAVRKYLADLYEEDERSREHA